jgi:hypothetical protein
VAANNFAVVAHLFDTCPDFHISSFAPPLDIFLAALDSKTKLSEWTLVIIGASRQ